MLVAEAVRVFDLHGYHDATVEEIGAGAGINASSVYRYFPSKSDLLAAVFHRAADRLAAATADTLASSDTPAEALVGLVDSYVDLSFRNPEVLSVYFAEIGNLPAAEQKTLRGIQRLNVEEWVALLVQVRPELDSAEARFVVHAALGLVLDVGRLVHFEPGQSERVAQLMRAALGVGAPHDGGGESEPRSEGR
nr:TetR/AcrR family transcriptional regulator [Rhodococcus sp. HNM0569]